MKSNYDIMRKPTIAENTFLQNVKAIVHAARQKAYCTINFAQVESNWLIGQRIVKQEQKGKDKAEYGQRIITLVSEPSTEILAHSNYYKKQH